MKTLCTEGKNGCVRAEILLSLFFLLFSNALHSQVPINGFCNAAVFETSKEYNNLFLSDLNFDKKEDVVLYDKISNSLLFHLSTVTNTLSEPIKKFFYFPISKIEEIKNSKASRTFLFLSRKEKLIGLASIQKNLKIRLLDVVSYKSTPSNFSVKKSSDGKATEAIIYGEPFEGIALLEIEDSKISEKRIFPDNVFKSAVWIDLNYDGNKDIAAYDIFDNELLLLINDGEDNFRLERKIKLIDRLRDLKSVDWNGDGYGDLFYSSDDGFEVLLGDSVSSFTRKEFFKTVSASKECLVSDFNNDGKPDIAWIEETGGGIFFVFSKKDSSYSKPQKYFQGIKFADIKKSLFNYAPSIFLLTNDGRIFKISSIAEQTDVNRILAKGSPVLIERFKTNRYNETSLAYFDSLSGSVNLLMSNMEVFNVAFGFHAAKNHSEFRAFFTSDSIRTFILFSKGEKLFEVFRFNIYNYSVKSFEIYSDKNLLDAIATDSYRGDYLLTLSKENDVAEINKYKLNGNKFSPRETIFSKSDILDASLSLGKRAAVCYLSKKGDSLFLSKKFLSDEKTEIARVLPGAANSYVPRLFLLASRKTEYPAIVNKNRRTIDVVIDNKIKSVPLPDNVSLPLKNIKMFYFMGFNYLFILSKGGNALTEAQLDSKMNLLGDKK
ncbi:MAG: VCBS repeat-containing protein, partial [Chlorobi bacterium]|nr:VCBS repeat-containing protein [Chlorobiota bacterium]